MRLIIWYFSLCGIALHLLLAAVFWKERAFIYEAQQKLERELIARGYMSPPPFSDDSIISVQKQLKKIFHDWQPLTPQAPLEGVWLNGEKQPDLATAIKRLKNGSLVQIGTGVYNEPVLINADDVIVEGIGDVTFERASVNGKGLFLIKGQRTTLKNIQCRDVQVGDGNGSCVRLEGKNLTLQHVYFHSSQSGILETSQSGGTVTIIDSRFEQLGFAGQAHGIYLNTADLVFNNSLMLATKDGGHGIKTRGNSTQISRSILATLGSNDSRLIDVSHGGFLQVVDSVLQEGPNSQNFQLIGFGLEGLKPSVNQVVMQRNLVLVDRTNPGQLIKTADNSVKMDITSNVFIGPVLQAAPNNIDFADREAAGIVAAPELPFTKAICGSEDQPLPSCPVKRMESE